MSYKFLLIMIILIQLIVSSLPGQETRETVAILDFNVISGLNEEAAATLTNIFRSQLIKTGKYNILERQDMESILEEQAFSLSGACNSAECAVEIGQLLSAEKMIIGDIGRIGETYSITLRLINVSNGSIEGSWDDKFKGKKDELLDVFKLQARKIAGVEEKTSKKWWYIGGAAIVGSTAAIVLLSGSDSPATKERSWCSG